MSLSELDWNCECCGQQFNPAMATVGLGDGDEYEKGGHGVCKNCSTPEHPFPCMALFGAAGPEVVPFGAKDTAGTRHPERAAEMMIEKFVSHLDRKLGGTHPVEPAGPTGQTPKDVVARFVTKWLYGSWTPYMPKDAMKKIEVKPCGSNHEIRIVIELRGLSAVIGMSATLRKPNGPKPDPAEAEVRWASEGRLAKDYAAISISGIRWERNAKERREE